MLAGAAFTSPLLALSLDAGAGRRVWLKPLLIALPLALAVRTSVAQQQRTFALLPVEVIPMARAARELAAAGDKVMARKPHLAWHAGLEAVPFPFADSLSQVAAAARSQDVRWLYFSWPEAEMRPAVAYLLDTTSSVPGLRVRAWSAKHPAVLYEILPGFGTEPDWAGDPALVALHRARANVLINRTDWRSRVYVAMHERTLERWTEAQVLIDEALAWAPAEGELQLLAADNLTRLGSLAAASTALSRAEGALGGDPRIAVARGWIAALDGDVAEAARWWRPVASIPGDERTLRRMREVFIETRDEPSLAMVEQRLDEMGVRP